MTDTFTQVVRGYCPEFGEDDHAVTAIYRKPVEHLGGFVSLPTLLAIRCRKIQTCQFVDDRGLCPVVKQNH